MRIDSIETAKTLAVPNPSTAYQFFAKILVRDMQIPLGQLPLDAPSTNINRTYLYLLAYMEEPPDKRYKDVYTYLQINQAKHQDILPDFFRLREFHRTHTYLPFVLSVNNQRLLDRLTREVPLYVLRTLGREAYNRFLLSYLRVSEVKDGSFTYVPDRQHSIKDVQISTSIGKILNKPTVFSIHSPLQERKLNALKHRIQTKLLGNSVVLKIAETDDEIYRVYNSGPRSCMSGISFIVDGKRLCPASVYNTEDIGVLYGTRRGRIIGRSIINRKTNEYVSFYGDGSFGEALRLEGYKNNTNALDGCKILRITIGTSNSVLMPYVDGKARFVHMYDKDYFTLSSKESSYCAGSTSGAVSEDVIYREPNPLCPRCDYRDWPEIDFEEVIVGFSTERWCPDCINEAAKMAINEYGGEEYVDRDNIPSSFVETENDGFLYTSERAAKNAGYVQAVNGLWYDDKLDVVLYEDEYYPCYNLRRYNLYQDPKTNEVRRYDVQDEAA